jgi:phosphoenolpyruvate carboxylase
MTIKPFAARDTQMPVKPATSAKSAKTAKAPATRNEPLLSDIRYLGRILGEVILEQEGREVFQQIETVRQLAVAFRSRKDTDAGKQLDRVLKGLSADRAISVIRAFSYFSHLANLAEDQHQVRLTRTAKLDAPGTLKASFERLASQGLHAPDVAAMLSTAYLSPVLTAHPTEVQRKSILDTERSISELIGRRREAPVEAQAELNQALRARITQLWQTRMLRFSKLTVADEIENVLSYYPATFLREIPKLYAQLEAAMPGQTIAPFLRMGHWIGGDRDGNPFVTAETLNLALSRQAEVALRHYLGEVHRLGAELSMSGRLVGVTPAMQALTDRRPTRTPTALTSPTAAPSPASTPAWPRPWRP